jgi:hypothetical protein
VSDPRQLTPASDPELWAALEDRKLLYHGDRPGGFIEGWEAARSSSPAPLGFTSCEKTILYAAGITEDEVEALASKLVDTAAVASSPVPDGDDQVGFRNPFTGDAFCEDHSEGLPTDVDAAISRAEAIERDLRCDECGVALAAPVSIGDKDGPFEVSDADGTSYPVGSWGGVSQEVHESEMAEVAGEAWEAHALHGGTDTFEEWWAARCAERLAEGEG